ncbi:hypothetical protein [Faecalimicrobium sp. JNUCC 81]
MLVFVVVLLNVKDEYFIFSKMGYSDRVIKKIIEKEVALMHMIPLVMGILNGLLR